MSPVHNYLYRVARIGKNFGSAWPVNGCYSVCGDFRIDRDPIFLGENLECRNSSYSIVYLVRSENWEGQSVFDKWALQCQLLNW